MLISQICRAAIILSAMGAIGVQLWLASRAWPPLLGMGAAAAGLGLISGRRDLAAGFWTLLGLIYLYPVVVHPFAGIQSGFAGVVLAGMLGLAIGAQPGWRWSLPTAWAAALSFTAIAIALTWPLIAFRELDFTFDRFLVTRQSITWRGIPPHVQIAFVAAVAGTHLVGVLFVDALVGRFRDDITNFRRLVLAPLAVSAAVSAAIAVYQMTADVQFLNPTIFAYLGRAAGTMLDANAFGAIAAMWAVGAAWLLLDSNGRGRFGLAVAAVSLFAAAVWATGSRTALLALLAGVPFLALAVVRRFRTSLSVRRVAAGLGILVVAAGLVGVVAARSDVVGPLSRLNELKSADGSVSEIVTELRDRGGYGTSARDIIADFPWTGSGVGTFHAMVLEYAMRHRRVWLTPDNAQNWFRHQVAELGWAGSAGFFLWALHFGVFAARRLFTGSSPAVCAAGGALAGVFAASLLGMPTQEVSVVTTFWVMVAWLSLAGGLPAPQLTSRRSSLLFGAVALAAVLYAAGTAHVAVTRLRVPHRAAATGWSYEYGFHRAEQSASGAFRWTTDHAVTVFEPRGKYLRLRFHARHPDLVERPVDVRVKLSGRTIIRSRLRSRAVVESYIEVPTETPHMMLEFFVDRTFAPTGGGRELGIAVEEWTFVDDVPENAWISR